MGKERENRRFSSFISKTDLESTFIRIEDDHMKNGQLKAAYNIQIAVENYFIVHTCISNDRTDYNTLFPVLEKHKNAFGEILEEVTADSGYCSEKNLLYLKKNKISSYIKQQSRACYDTSVRHGKQIPVMEPVKGGLLVVRILCIEQC